MEFAVLGAVTASRTDGSSVDLGPLLHRTVLAALLVEDGRVVSIAAILERVWGERAGSSTTGALHAVISRLRSAVGKNSILTSAPGYRVAVSAGSIDALRFRHLLARARALRDADSLPAARDAAAAALQLWRGEAYADIPTGFARQAAARLGEDRTNAAALKSELDLVAGLHGPAADDLRELVIAHPLREDLRALHMVALYRSGRQADALQSFHEGRGLLADEVGIDPGPDLLETYRRILRHEPELLHGMPVITAPRRAVAQARSTPPADPIIRFASLPLTTMVGREQDIQEVLGLLEQHRLVTVLGTGGVGKSRLVLETLGRITASDGPWFAELADLNDEALLAETVADAMNLHPSTTATELAASLATRSTLLVLDNCEQLAAGIARFAVELLRRCPTLKILTTSREVLGVTGEAVHVLPPLSDDAARSLFSDRAAAVNRNWRAPAPDDRLLTGICRTLDNLPLALELAAAQCRLLSVAQLAAVLDDRFTVLERARGTHRHASMRAVVQWSYDRLAVDDRAAFDDLGVLEGHFDLHAAAAATGRPDIVAALATLADTSMLQVLTTEPRRYRMLETLRDFAAINRTPQTTTAVRNRIVQRLDQLTEHADEGLRGPDENRWMQVLGDEHTNLRAALEWTDVDPGVQFRIAVRVSWFWYVSGHNTTGAGILDRLYAAAESTAEPTTLLRSSVGQALLAYLAGRYPAALAYLQRADQLIPDAEDQDAQAYALATIAYFDAALGRIDDALDRGHRALALARSIGSHQRAADAQQAVGMAHFRGGRLAEAEQVLGAAVADAEAAKYRWCAASAGWIMAKVRISRGNFSSTTINDLADAIDGCHTQGDVTSWLVLLDTLAYILFRRDLLAESGELTGITGSWSTLIGFSPQAMDPVDLESFRADMQSHSVPAWQDGVRRGARLSGDHALQRIDILVRFGRGLQDQQPAPIPPAG